MWVGQLLGSSRPPVLDASSSYLEGGMALTPPLSWGHIPLCSHSPHEAPRPEAANARPDSPAPIPQRTVRGQVLSGLVGQASLTARASSASSQVHKLTSWALRSQAGPRVGKGWMGTEAPGSQLSLLPFKERPPRYWARCPTPRNKCDLSSDLQLTHLPSDLSPNPGP